MTTFLVVWVGIGAGVAATARKYLGASWRRAVGSGLIWPTFPGLILASRIRYGLRRRSVP